AAHGRVRAGQKGEDGKPQVDGPRPMAQQAGGTAGRHTFSGIRAPSRPFGRNSRMTTRMPNTSASLHSSPAYRLPSDRTSPSTMAPKTAPGMFPIPPRTAAVNAYS